MLSIVVCSVLCALRALLLFRPVQYSPADETAVLRQATSFRWADFRMLARFYPRCPGLWDSPGPMRVGSLLLLSWVLRLVPGHRGMALVSTIASCASVVLGEAIALRLGAHPGVGAIVVGCSPLVLGLGRRALQDVPLLALQLSAAYLITLGPAYAPEVFAAVTLGLLFKESALPGLPLLYAFAAWRWGCPTWPVTLATFAGPQVVWFAVMTRLLGETPLTFLLRVLRRPPSADPYQRLIRGGVHRLVVDLILCSPAAVFAAAWLLPAHDRGALAVLAVGLLGYGTFMLQEIRIALILDCLLRACVAVWAPWWAVLAIAACDVYVYYRVWYRGGLYDPTTVWLAQLLGMGP